MLEAPLGDAGINHSLCLSHQCPCFHNRWNVVECRVCRHSALSEWSALLVARRAGSNGPSLTLSLIEPTMYSFLSFGQGRRKERKKDQVGYSVQRMRTREENDATTKAVQS